MTENFSFWRSVIDSFGRFLLFLGTVLLGSALPDFPSTLARAQSGQGPLEALAYLIGAFAFVEILYLVALVLFVGARIRAERPPPLLTFGNIILIIVALSFGLLVGSGGEWM